MNNYSYDLLVEYLKKENYFIKPQKIKERLFSDPDAGVLAITNTLDFFQIENLAVKVPKTSLKELPKSFIAEFQNNDQSRLVLITKFSENFEVFIDTKNTVILSHDDFIKNWTGLIIAIEENDSKKPIDTNKWLNRIAIAFLVLLPLIYVISRGDSLSQLGYFALSITGVIISLLITYEKFGGNAFLSKVCTISKKTSCSQVINSKSAKLFNSIDIGDVCVSYFTFQLLEVLFIPNTTTYIVLTIVAPIGILYSLYHQMFTIKKWCPLCLGVVGVLAIQFVLIFSRYNGFNFHFNLLLVELFLSITIVFVWQKIKALLHSYQENETLAIENLKFRRNYYLFLPYYNSLKEIETSTKEHQFTLGSSNPLVKVLVVISPSCVYCKEVVMTLKKKLLNIEETQVNIRLLISETNKESIKVQMLLRLIHLYETEGKNSFLEALEDWYTFTNANLWFKKWGKQSNKKAQEYLKEHYSWSKKNNINATPKLFINNRLFPNMYEPKDLINFIEPLIEHKKQNQNSQ